MKKHNHTHCKHELEFCKHCDVVYCGKCSEEWKKYTGLYWGTGTTYCNAVASGTGGCTITGTSDSGFAVGGDTLEIKHKHNH